VSKKSFRRTSEGKTKEGHRATKIDQVCARGKEKACWKSPARNRFEVGGVKGGILCTARGPSYEKRGGKETPFKEEKQEWGGDPQRKRRQD